MNNNTFIKSTIILIIGGMITKILGMFIKIITNRFIGLDSLSLYMLITPTFMLLVSICQMGFPIAISKLVSAEDKNNKNLILSIIPVSIIINLFIMIIFLFLSKFIAINLLHNASTIKPLKCMAFTLPFISISSILRGYFLGKQRMIPPTLSNIIEDIVKLITLYVGIPLFLDDGIDIVVCFIILSNIISEITSIIIFILFLPKNNINKKDFIINKKYIKDIFDISIPNTLGRLANNIAYFIEPIILTYFLSINGYSNTYIVKEYGIITGYVTPLLLLPSFFTSSISQALIPVVSKSFIKNNINLTKKKIKQSIVFSLIVGIPATIIYLLFPELLLKFIYNTNSGIKYIKFLSLIYLLYYIDIPLVSSLQSMGYSKIALKNTLIGLTFKSIALIILTNLKIGMWSLVLSSSINIIINTILNISSINKYLNVKQKKIRKI